MLQAYLMRQNPEELIRSRYGDMLLHQIQEQMLTTKTLGHMVDLILGREPKPAPEVPAAAKEAGAAQSAHEHDHEHDPAHAHGHEHEHSHDHEHD